MWIFLYNNPLSWILQKTTKLSRQTCEGEFCVVCIFLHTEGIEGQWRAFRWTASVWKWIAAEQQYYFQTYFQRSNDQADWRLHAIIVSLGVWMFWKTDKWQQSKKIKTHRVKWVRLVCRNTNANMVSLGILTNHIRSTALLCRTQCLFHQNLTKASMKFTMILHFHLTKSRHKKSTFYHVYFEIQLRALGSTIGTAILFNGFLTNTKQCTVTSYIKVGKMLAVIRNRASYMFERSGTSFLKRAFVQKQTYKLFLVGESKFVVRTFVLWIWEMIVRSNVGRFLRYTL